MSFHQGHRSAGIKVSAQQQFMKISIGIMLVFMSVIYGWVFLSSVVSSIVRPIAEKLSGNKFVQFPGFASLALEAPTKLGVQVVQKDAFLQQKVYHEVWVVKHSAGDASVFSPTCSHLGCQFGWDASSKTFICPCHASIFAMSGKVLGGPAPRPLDTLQYKIENGELYVEWRAFEPGIQQKIAI